MLDGILFLNMAQHEQEDGYCYDYCRRRHMIITGLHTIEMVNFDSEKRRRGSS